MGGIFHYRYCSMCLFCTYYIVFYNYLYMRQNPSFLAHGKTPLRQDIPIDVEMPPPKPLLRNHTGNFIELHPHIRVVILDKRLHALLHVAVLHRVEERAQSTISLLASVTTPNKVISRQTHINTSGVSPNVVSALNTSFSASSYFPFPASAPTYAANTSLVTSMSMRRRPSHSGLANRSPNG